MKTVSGLFVILTMISLNGWAQGIDYDKRNAHIFCASHLAVISEALDQQGDGYQALVYLSDMHRKEAKGLGATGKDFDDVAGYLKKVRKNDKQKWNRLSAQSKKICVAAGS